MWYYMVDIRKKTEEYYMEVAFVKKEGKPG
jgi:hypothetical protein